MVDGEHADAEPRDARYGTHWRESIILADRQAFLDRIFVTKFASAYFLPDVPSLAWMNCMLLGEGRAARDGIAVAPPPVVMDTLIHP